MLHVDDLFVEPEHRSRFNYDVRSCCMYCMVGKGVATLIKNETCKV